MTDYIGASAVMVFRRSSLMLGLNSKTKIDTQVIFVEVCENFALFLKPNQRAFNGISAKPNFLSDFLGASWLAIAKEK